MTAENIFISRVAVLRVEASLALRKGCSRAALSPFPRIAMYGEELCGEGRGAASELECNIPALSWVDQGLVLLELLLLYARLGTAELCRNF